MSEFQYCYWLMGMFELSETKSFELGMDKTYLIMEHLKLVKTREHSFCSWLEGFLEGLKTFENSEIPEMSYGNVDRLFKRLSEEFENVIDPSYPKEKSVALNKAHQGEANNATDINGNVESEVKNKPPKLQSFC